MKIGSQVVSFHRAKTYDSWVTFKPELDRVVDALFSIVPELTITRLDLRYMNALNSTLYGITSMEDLDFSLKIASEFISGGSNVNYKRSASSDVELMVRMATPDFVQGVVPENATVFVDIDCFTGSGFAAKNATDVKSWVERSHDIEKDEFFHLLKQSTIDSLKEF